jgi:hypothetical protein
MLLNANVTFLIHKLSSIDWRHYVGEHSQDVNHNDAFKRTNAA